MRIIYKFEITKQLRNLTNIVLFNKYVILASKTKLNDTNYLLFYKGGYKCGRIASK